MGLESSYWHRKYSVKLLIAVVPNENMNIYYAINSDGLISIRNQTTNSEIATIILPLPGEAQTGYMAVNSNTSTI